MCVSHLWWSWVYQRPQHLMSRLAAEHPVLFVEEPRIRIGPPGERRELLEEVPGVTVVRHTYSSDATTFWRRIDETRDSGGGHPSDVSPDITEGTVMFGSFAQPVLERSVVHRVRELRHTPLILWLYTPMAAGFVELLEPDLVVYDVMDDLAAFRFAPPELLERQDRLLRRADVVFAGGPSLHAGISRRRPGAHMFPSGVDVEHFGAAADGVLAVPQTLRAVSRPRIGYVGVIDERIDLELLAAAADLRPDWSWVMVGPVTKIPTHQLPRRPNLVYAGQQPYEALPAYLGSLDVAMMPFAHNDSTRAISPTKTLEYLAAGRPVVSTSVPDVVSMYGSVVRFGDDPSSFVGQIAEAMAESETTRAARPDRAAPLLGRYSWDGTVEQMHAVIGSALTG